MAPLGTKLISNKGEFAIVREVNQKHQRLICTHHVATLCGVKHDADGDSIKVFAPGKAIKGAAASVLKPACDGQWYEEKTDTYWHPLPQGVVQLPDIFNC